jgi:hypothetical protein
MSLRHLSLTFALLALIGFWGPWLASPAAGLSFNGYELSEWVTFLPATRDGTLAFAYWRFPFGGDIYFARLAFFVPFGLVAWSLCLAIARSPASVWIIPPGAPTLVNTPNAALLTRPRSRGALLIALTLGLAGALVIVPSYSDIRAALIDPELASQLAWQLAWAGLVALGSVVMLILPAWAQDLWQSGCGFIGLGLTLWAMNALMPIAHELLNAAWPIGWGLIVYLLGLGGLSLVGLRQLFAPAAQT